MKEAVSRSKSSVPPGDPIVRFGNYEVDLRAGELRRGGLKVKLGGQPFDVLVTLLEKPGQVVTREDLHDKLWSQDTFVDFEHGLNKAINKVREALGDDADNPRFIETLPRRGYRFLAPVMQPAPEALAEQNPADHSPASLPLTKASVLRKRWPLRLAASTAVAIALVSVFVGSRPHLPPQVLRYTQLTNDGLQKSGLTTDGSRIYFGEPSQQPVIAQVSVKGGPVSTLAALPSLGPTNSAYAPNDYSPVRSELLITAGFTESPLWALNVPGGSARRRLGDFVVEDAAWSPDGQSIIYSKINELDVAKADGSDSRRLAAVRGDPAYMRWSPDGKRLRFTLSSSDNVRSSLWEIAADGSNLHPLFPDWQSRNDETGSWTPDGKYFVFRSTRDGRGSIFAMRDKKGPLARGIAEPVELTTGPMSFSAPIPSVDGKQIFANGFLDRGELIRYDVKRQAWDRYLSGISAADLDFSRDGEWVTYVLVPEGTLWRSRVDGSEKQQLTIPPLRTSMPRWSPDGKQIAFVALKPGGVWTIYLVPADGGEAEQLLFDNKFYQDPNWSPDGSHLVFGESNWSPKAIHIMDLRSRRISDLPESDGLFSPRWSPDGRFILGLTASMMPTPQGSIPSQQRPIKLMLFDVSRRKWKECSRALYMSYPAFSKNGEYVYFSDSTAIFSRVRLAGGNIEPVARIDVAGQMKTDAFWYWTGLTPDDSPIYLRDASTREIYALDVDLP
jgi:Tol biopolymer transport system component/DNA-binding winged helix-turn-helix (wHTH) protein